MSMTVANAKLYVARVLGGSASTESLDEANEAILRGYQDWQSKHLWRFLLKDTSKAYTVTATPTNSTGTISPVTAGDLDFVNVGYTLTGSVYSGTATVTAVTRGSDGVVTSITTDGTASAGTNTAFTFTTLNIPIIAGTNDYSLPPDFQAAFTARFTVNPITLIWRDQRYWDRNITNQSITGTPSEYTHYNPYSDLSQNFGTEHLKFDVIPAVADTLLLRYYRKFNTTGTYIDMPDTHLYQFLDYCRGLMVANKAAKDNPSAFFRSAADGAESAKESDNEPNDDNDIDQCLKAGYENADFMRRLWGNGQFDAQRY